MSEEKTTSQSQLQLERGTLWTKVVRQTKHARQCGALQSIETEYELIEQNDIRFVVRTLSNLVRKEKDLQRQKREAKSGKEVNPFLPYDEDLFVSDISETHLCLLNKFNVVDHHLLIVTRQFEAQENSLNLQDFEALWACMQEIDGLAFYNSGKTAGASQPHKHLQLIPLPLIPQGERIPIEGAIAKANCNHSFCKIPSFPFQHAIAKLDLTSKSPQQAATIILNCYHNLLNEVGLVTERDNLIGAYNLLATREWMAIVPRSRESYHSIAVNSLGFAGSLFVPSQEQMKILKELQPITILQNVARS